MDVLIEQKGDLDSIFEMDIFSSVLAVLLNGS